MKKTILYIVMLIGLAQTPAFAETTLNTQTVSDELVQEMIEEVDGFFYKIAIDSGELPYNGVSGFLYDSNYRDIEVKYVEKGSISDKVGLFVGDIIIKINDIDVDYTDIIVGDSSQRLSLLIVRGVETLTIDMDFREFKGTQEQQKRAFQYKKNNGIFETKSFMDIASLYENEYSLISELPQYEKVIIYYNTTQHGWIKRPRFILDGKIDAKMKIKKIIGNRVIIGAKDVSKTYEGKKNYYEGDIYIKHNGGYYYGSYIEAGYFDLGNVGKKEEIRLLLLENNIHQYNQRILNVKKRLGRFKKSVGEKKNNEHMIKVNEIIQNKINLMVKKIHSEKDFIWHSDILRSYLIIEKVIGEGLLSTGSIE